MIKVVKENPCKEEIEKILVSYGVPFTDVLADKLLEVIDKARADERAKVIDFILEKITIRCEDCKFYNSYADGVRCGCTDIKECNSKIKADWLEQLKEKSE